MKASDRHGVYFAFCSEQSLVKIGRTTSRRLGERIKEIQVHCPLEIDSWMFIPETERFNERAAHCLLAKYRVRGEWFHNEDNAIRNFAIAWHDEYDSMLKELRT